MNKGSYHHSLSPPPASDLAPDSGIAELLSRVNRTSPSRRTKRGVDDDVPMQAFSENKGTLETPVNFNSSADDLSMDGMDEVSFAVSSFNTRTKVSITDSASLGTKTLKGRSRAKKYEIGMLPEDPKEYLTLCKREIGKSSVF